jgi:hypothetical protein
LTLCQLHSSPPALLQPAKVACVEYPREPGKDEQYAWVCLYKAVAVADALLGARAQVGWRARACAGPGHDGGGRTDGVKWLLAPARSSRLLPPVPLPAGCSGAL